jgi:hypothetical protein
MPLQRQDDSDNSEFAPAITYRMSKDRRRKLEWLVEHLNYRSMTALIDALIEQEYEAQGGEQNVNRQG